VECVTLMDARVIVADPNEMPAAIAGIVIR
jgi:hypothetical protein